MNFANYKKSRFFHKSTKSGKDDNNPEDKELKKYEDVVEKLNQLFPSHPRKDLTGSLNPESAVESSNNFSSNIRRTTSRTKEILNDRDFLINFMNDDTMPILPKNMHLLTDDDTNLNIDDKTKFKKLADLLLDDKETVKESFFINTVEEKMILKLYTALSRKSKDIFMEENSDNKDNKKRILLHKLNKIEIPHFNIEDKDKDNINLPENPSLNLNINHELNDEQDDNDNSILNKLKKKQKNESIQKISLSNSINILSGINSLRRKSKFLIKEKPQFSSDCKYNKKNKSIKVIKIPSLEYKPIKFHNKKTKRFITQPEKNEQWEPDIDGDLLAYINHNIVKIEDIYNKGKENIFELKENQDEEVKQIEAKEITFDLSQSQNEDESDINATKNKSIDYANNAQTKRTLTNISDEEDTEIKNKNKFCEYKDRLPKIIEISLSVEPEQKKMSDFNKELKALYSNRINEIGELGEELFPTFGDNLKHDKIYKYALNNERNEEIVTDNFTLTGVSTKVDISISGSDMNKKDVSNIKNNTSNENFENNVENSQNKEDNNNNYEEQENKSEKEKKEDFNNINLLSDNENYTNNLYSLEDKDINDNNNEEQNMENNNYEETEENNKIDEEKKKTDEEENKKDNEENKKNDEEENKKRNEYNKKIFFKNYINNDDDDEEEEDDF